MENCMFGCRDNHQVFNAVVQFVTVHVVYVLGGLQWPSERLLHYYSVLSYPFRPSKANGPVSILVNPSLALSFRWIKQYRWITVFMETTVMKFAEFFAVLNAVASIKRTWSFLGTSFSYQRLFRVTVGKVTGVMFLAKAVTVYIVRAAFNRAGACDEQTKASGRSIVSFTVPALDCWFLAFRTNFHLVPPNFYCTILFVGCQG